MAIVQVLGIADLPESSGLSTLVEQPTTPLRSITGFLPSSYSGSRPGTVTTNKLDPCARLANLQAIGARLSPEQAKQATLACREARGIAPDQTARYQPTTGEITAIDATTGETVTMDATTGQQIDPTTGLPITPWYKNPTYWLIGGAVLVGGILLLK